MRHNVDALRVRDGRLFAYGWAFDSTRPVKELTLRVTLADRRTVCLPVVAGKERPDVAAVFAGESQARWSGWMAYGGWDRSDPRCVELAGVLEDGHAFTLPLQVGQNRYAQGNWLHALLASQSQTAAQDEPGAPVGSDDEIVAALRESCAAAGMDRAILVIDHAMGGGASHYRKEWVQRRLGEVPLLLLLTFDVHSLSYALEFHSGAGVLLRLPCTGDLPAKLAGSGLVGEVFLNDAVSFPRSGDVPHWLLAFAGAGATVSIAIHDYLTICPSPFLLNDVDVFCGVPDMNECIRCMRCNTNDFPSVQPSPDMPSWRREWGAALAAARTVLCFSESSRRLLRRAYPALDPARIELVPHQVKPFASRVRRLGSGPLHIGVVGAIGMHKGARVLQELAREIARRGSPARITVFGTLEAVVDGGIVQVTGPYEREALPAMIEQSGANVFLLPSICPETFSFVTHELIGLELPLACFDLGAPADRVRDYPHGRVLRQHGPARLLDDLEAFYRDSHLITSPEGVL